MAENFRTYREDFSNSAMYLCLLATLEDAGDAIEEASGTLAEIYDMYHSLEEFKRNKKIEAPKELNIGSISLLDD